MSHCEIMIRNRRDEFPRIVDAIDRFAAEHRLSGNVISDLQIALDEILTNIVDYGYTDEADHEIRILLRIVGNVLEAIIEDDGIEFDPLAISAPDINSSLHERRAGGLGLHFVRNLTSDVAYERIGFRNRLVLKKLLKS